MQKNRARISLVGAGPGDPELITLKGLRALRSADVVLYDALVNEALLEEAPRHALRVFVGKRAGRHSHSQSEINRLLVQYALSHGHVVRLKGGDPFVFGRGHEELSYARAFGIPVAVVPGLSSCTSVPALQQVPVTRRGVNDSFWVLTGTTRSGSLSKDVELAARSSATVIILMGMRKLREIAALFQAAGRGDTPALVVQSGSLPEERAVLGRVNDIAERVKEAQLGAPGIIVIGEVVALHPEYARGEVGQPAVTVPLSI
ncbi:MAG: uroporphyrinogen-III C-methyltransferase [Bacteroidetes bacterium]|nr:MAG: uroporphyrinogen-III C-methyltransferase [Bacteroidota bacterium]